MLRVEKICRIFTRYVFDVRIDFSSNDPSGFLHEIYVKYLSRKVRREKVYALKDISFSLKKGELLTVIGPNGSGKTTLLKILSGILLPSSGRIFVNDVDITNASYEVYSKYFTYLPGLMTGGIWVNEGLTARKNLEVFAEMYGLDKSRINEVLELVGLENASNRRVGTFSTGMIGRLVLAAGLLRASPIYLLDEPLVGVSREVVVDILNLLKKIVKKDRAIIIYATNNLGEVEEIADKILFLYEGRQVFYGSVDEFRNLLRKFVIEIEYVGGDKFSRLVDQKEVYSILSSIIHGEKPLRTLKIGPPSIEDVYLYIIRKRM